jgi:hypothetical protein
MSSRPLRPSTSWILSRRPLLPSRENDERCPPDGEDGRAASRPAEELNLSAAIEEPGPGVDLAGS